MMLTEKFASLELEIEDLKNQIDWYEKGMKEIQYSIANKGINFFNREDIKEILNLTVSYLDGEPTTADPYNSGDDIEYNYSNKVGKRITFKSI